MLFPSCSGTHWWCSNKSRIDGIHLFHTIGKGTFITEEVNGFFSQFWGLEWIPGGKEEDKARQAVFLTPLNPFGKDREEEKPRSHYTVPQKAPIETRWKRNQDARWKEAQDQGLQFWQTKSFAIMAYFTIPGDWIDRVTAQNGDRVFFERLATPTKRNWQSQQQQQEQQPPISNTDVPSIWKQGATWESLADVQDDSKHIVEADPVLGNREQTTSQMNVDTHLSDKEVSTNALVKNEAVKEELTDTNTKALKKTKLVQIKFVFAKIWRRRRWCLAKNPAKLFSRWLMWSSLSWRHPWFNSHPAYTTFFTGTILSRCGKHIRPDLAMMRRIKICFWSPEGAMLSHACE